MKRAEARRAVTISGSRVQATRLYVSEDGKTKARFRLNADGYPNQSYAVVEMWTGTGWKEVVTTHGPNLYTKNAHQPDLEDRLDADETLVVERAAIVLDPPHGTWREYVIANLLDGDPHHGELIYKPASLLDVLDKLHTSYVGVDRY